MPDAQILFCCEVGCIASSPGHVLRVPSYSNITADKIYELACPSNMPFESSYQRFNGPFNDKNQFVSPEGNFMYFLETWTLSGPDGDQMTVLEFNEQADNPPDKETWKFYNQTDGTFTEYSHVRLVCNPTRVPTRSPTYCN